MVIPNTKILPVEAVAPKSSGRSIGEFTSGIKVLGTFIPSQKSNSKIRSYPGGGILGEEFRMSSLVSSQET